MGRPPKEKSLSQKDVVAAAIRCIDEEGAAALGVSRVARSLGIKPPAIYKHLESGAALQQEAAIELWRQHLAECERVMGDHPITNDLLKQLGHFTRNFAKAHPARYQVMMQVQLHPDDPKAGAVIRELLGFLHRALSAYDLSQTQLIDVMRMFNAATYGFIAIEQQGLMTLERSLDESYDVMLEALIRAIKHVQKNS